MNNPNAKFALGDIVRYKVKGYKGFEVQTGFVIEVLSSHWTKDDRYRICWFDHHGVDSLWYNGIVFCSLM
jgi:hypothetical protein